MEIQGIVYVEQDFMKTRQRPASYAVLLVIIVRMEEELIVIIKKQLFINLVIYLNKTAWIVMIQLEFTSVAEIQGTVNVYQDILIKVRGAAIRAIFLVEIVRMEMEIIVIFK
jgi:hypothetical protein